MPRVITGQALGGSEGWQRADLGLVLAAGSAPLVLLLLSGGVWADRVARHRIMIDTDLIRAALHAGLAVLILVGEVRIWQVVVIEACFGAAQAFFQPAYTGLVPQTVAESLIQEARTLTESMANLATLLGPALATLLVLGIGPSEAFAVGAATFVLSVTLLTRVRPRPRGTAAAPARVLDDLFAGWREVVSRPWVWVTIVVAAGAILCADAPWFALALSVARFRYWGGRCVWLGGDGDGCWRSRGLARGPRLASAASTAEGPFDRAWGAVARHLVRAGRAAGDRAGDGVCGGGRILALLDLVGDRARTPHPAAPHSRE